MTSSSIAAEQISAFLARPEATTPDAAIASAQLILLNGLRASLAARDEPLARRLISSQPVEKRTSGGASILLSGLRADHDHAALCNQFMWTMLLLDDLEMTSGMHPGGPAAIGALATATEHPVSGRGLLAAIVAGIEVQIAVALAGAPEMLQERGFAPLSVLAPLGAAAAGAVVAGASPGESAHAVGMAAMSGGGMWEMGGTSSATFLTARGTCSGLAALRAAACGVEAPPRAIDGPFGAFHAYSGKSVEVLMDRLATLGTEWRTTKVMVQPYSGDTFSQAALEAVARIRSKGAIATDAIQSVTVLTDERTAIGVARKVARHSTIGDALALNSDPPSRVAVALLGGSYSWDQTFPDLAHDPKVADLRKRIRFVHDSSIADMLSAIVEVRLTDGEVRRARIDRFTGSTGNPQTYEGMSAWFHEVADARIGADRARRVVELIAALPEASSATKLLSELA